jgi:hypothetical protein
MGSDGRLYRLATGPAGEQLGLGADQLSCLLGPVDFELGVITGSRGLNPLRFVIQGPSNGRLAVEEAMVEGMTDLLVVRRGHTFIMNDPRVIDQAIHFFRHGRFARPVQH